MSQKPLGDEYLKDHSKVNSSVEKLRSKLRGFTVRDRQGKLLGNVEDLILDENRNLNLVIRVSKPGSKTFLVLSKLIQKIEPLDKLLNVDVDQTEIEQLSEYVTQNNNEDNVNMTVENNIETTKENLVDVDNTSKLEETIRLLSERLVVNRSKRKVGEVIIRKQIETRMVQVPIRYEKLIVEQVSPEHKQLVEIELGQQEVEEILGNDLTVIGDFNSPKIASLVLNAIAMERLHGCKQVRVQIVVEDSIKQKTYQEWFDRCSTNQSAVELRTEI